MTSQDSTSGKKRLIGLFPELLGVGGVQEAGRQTAAALREIVDRHGWLSSFFGLNDRPGEQVIFTGDHHIPFRGFGRAKVPFVLSAIRHARKDASIVLASHPNLALPAAWMKTTSPRLRTIVMSHGIEVWKPLPWVRRRALLLADFVLAPSHDTLKKLIHVQSIPKEKVRLLPWPLSPSFLRLADAPLGLPLPPGFPQGRIILTVGRWAASERYKGVDDLIRAVAQLGAPFPRVHLVAVGGGNDIPRLRKLAYDLGVADRAWFISNLSTEEIAACYARADVFALPSSGEGFGLVFLEAMAFAKPLVGAACGGTMDLVKDGINGLLVPPGDARRLVQALGQLLSDESLCAKLGQRGAEIVRENFRFDIFEAQLEKILGDCRLAFGKA